MKQVEAEMPGNRAALRADWRRRPLVLVGMMGSGKTTVGKRLAARLHWPFVDADAEIERAAAMPIPEIFARFGEPHFRDGERRVIARLMEGGHRVIATGGGAFADPETRELILRRGTAIWLDADIQTLVARVSRRGNRPLLAGRDPKQVLTELAAVRNPAYAQSPIRIISRDAPHEETVDAILEALMGPNANNKAAITTVPVALGARSYDVHVGAGALMRLPAALGDSLRPLAVVTDSHVADHHLPRLRDALAGRDLHPIILPPGESSKGWPTLERLVEQLLALELTRADPVLAFGGGVIGDLTGFAAAIVKRGIPFIQIPTTLLAMVDSSVGGKTAINAAAGKNLVGAFHQPSAVIADLSLLATLPPRELAAGYAEIVKYGLIDDPAFFAWCEEHGAAVLAGDRAAQAEAVARSVQAKAAVVRADERETQDVRALLNLGHTFGHALEAETGFSDRLLHGEAVAIGMALAYRYSAHAGLCPPEDAARVTAHLQRLGMKSHPAEAGIAADAAPRLIAHMLHDKKRTATSLPFILARGIGQAYVDHAVPLPAVEAFLRAELAG